MAHPKAVPVDLGGTTRHLLYDMNALCALRDINIDAFTLDEDRLKDPRTLRGLVWAGLLAESSDVTVQDVGSWMDLENLGPVAEAFTAAFQRSMKAELSDPR